MSEWQAIETAPRDGTRVLLWAPHWHAPQTGWTFGTDAWQDCPKDSYAKPPTHWRPLPEPPVASRAAESSPLQVLPPIRDESLVSLLDNEVGASNASRAGTRDHSLAPTEAEPSGEEFLEFKEALSDLRSLRWEHECLNGGGPGWSARNKAAWARVDELFANEDEAAWCRQQEDAHG